MELIEKVRKLRKELEDAESALDNKGFRCEDDEISLKYKAPEALRRAVASATRSFQVERQRLLRKFDVAMLELWATEDAARAKSIVESLL